MATRISRFASYLRNLLVSNDITIMEMVAKTLASLALVSGSKASGYVEFEVKTALEWLYLDRVEVVQPPTYGSKRNQVVLLISSQNDMQQFWF